MAWPSWSFWRAAEISPDNPMEWISALSNPLSCRKPCGVGATTSQQSVALRSRYGPWSRRWRVRENFYGRYSIRKRLSPGNLAGEERADHFLQLPSQAIGHAQEESVIPPPGIEPTGIITRHSPNAEDLSLQDAGENGRVVPAQAVKDPGRWAGTPRIRSAPPALRFAAADPFRRGGDGFRFLLRTEGPDRSAGAPHLGVVDLPEFPGELLLIVRTA